MARWVYWPASCNDRLSKFVESLKFQEYSANVPLINRSTSLQHEQPTTSDTSRWNTLPSFPYSMLHSVVSACLHQFGWNIFPTLPSGRGRETQLYRQCFMINKGTLIVSNGKGFNYVSRHTGLWSQTTSWKLTSIYGWEKMRAVSDCSEVFQNGERRSQDLSFTPKTQKTGIGYRPTCTGEERTPKSPPYNCD